MSFFSNAPSLNFTVRTGPSTLVTVWPTAPLVMVRWGARPPRPMSIAIAAHALGENAQLYRLLCAVGLRNAAAGDIVARLDVGGRRLDRATTSALSASFSMTGPLAALMYSVLPSTLSRVPATRCVVGCCADAVETANTAAKAAAVMIRIVLMSVLPMG